MESAISNILWAMHGPISICILFIFLVHPAANYDIKIKINDDVLTESNLEELNNFVSDVLTWKQRSVLGNERKTDEKSFWHSHSNQDVLFSKISSWKSLQQLALSHMNLQDLSHKLWPFNVQGSVLYRGDFPQIQEVNNSTLCTLFLFICKNWGKNYYGEVLIFNNNGEYLESVHPKNGRVVVVPTSLNYMVKPPSMNTDRGLMVISLDVTSNIEALLVSKPSPEYNDIRFTITPREKYWQIAKHITKEFKTVNNKKIVVFDDIFTKDELSDFLNKIDQGVYHYQPPSPDSEDNVMWILGLEVSNFLQSDLWPILKETLMVATGSKNYYPYDVSCNNIQTWHHPKLHRDCLGYENDHTLLVYLTPNWTDSYYGETVFYNNDEIFAVVRPRFGRLVVFHGTIWHSARTPSPLFKGPRYTFALKCAPTKEKAMRKQLILTYESLFSFDEEIVGAEKAAEIDHFTKMLKDGEGQHEEMEKMAMKFESELEQL